ncbi:MAG: hypothetical protein GXY83_00015 [Rhodopirellula sp.]|nr:hypothetical protein [Rhodopirellula sp.]
MSTNHPSTGCEQLFARIRIPDGRPLRIPMPPPPPNTDPALGLMPKPAPVYLLPEKFRPRRFASDGNGKVDKPPKPKRRPGRPRREVPRADAPSALSPEELWDLRPDDPWRPVDWRWRLAGHYAAVEEPPPQACGDDLLLAWFYQLIHPRCQSDRDRGWLRIWLPYVHEVVRIREHRPTTLEIEARLLAQEPIPDIVRKLKCSAQSITLFQSLYFDIGDRLEAPGWIAHRVIRLQDDPGTEPLEQLGKLWKMYGYWAGPLVLDELIYDITQGPKPTSADAVKRFFNESATAAIRRKACLALQLLRIDKPSVARRLMRAAQHLMEMDERERRRQHQAGPVIDPLPGVRATLAELPAGYLELLRRDPRAKQADATGNAAKDL